MRFLIINWKDKIKAFQDAATNKNKIIKNIKKDLKLIKSTLSDEEEVILVFESGSRYEIYPIYGELFEHGNNFKRSFTEILEIKALEKEIIETENTLRDLLKNNPVQLASFEEYVDCRHTVLLFTVYFYKNNKINKTYKGITYKDIEAYVHRILNDFGIAI